MRKITVLLCALMSLILLSGAVSAETDPQTLRKVAGQTLRMELAGRRTVGTDLYLDLRQSGEKHFDSRQIEGLKAGDRLEVTDNWAVDVYSVEPDGEGYLVRDDEFEYLFTKQADGTYTGMRKADGYRFADASAEISALVSENAVYIRFSEDGTYAVLGYDELFRDVDDGKLYEAEAAEFTFGENGEVAAVQTGYAETAFLTSEALQGEGLITDDPGESTGAAEGQEPPAAGKESEKQESATATPNRASVNLRAKPDKTSKKLAEIKKGTIVRILDETTGEDGKTWYLVDADGQEGYIRSDMLTVQAD